MKIRIVLADMDKKYREHFVRAFRIYYFNEVDVVTFSDLTALKKYIAKYPYDILLSDSSFVVDEASEKNIILTAEYGIKQIGEKTAICKYQKTETLYKEILNTIAEQKTDVTYSYDTTKESPVIAFTSAAGGVGKTTAALVYARQLAKKGYQVLYLSLESFSNVDYFLNAEGNTNFSNILFAIKCGKGNLQMKIESTLKQTYGGLYFFSRPINPIEVNELEKSEWQEFFDAAKAMGKFHCIVVDLPCVNENAAQRVLPLSNQVILITDGKDTTTEKTQIMMSLLRQIDETEKTSVSTKIRVIQNKCDGPRREIGIPILTEIPYIKESKMEKVIIDSLVNSDGVDLLTIYQPGGQNYV